MSAPLTPAVAAWLVSTAGLGCLAAVTRQLDEGREPLAIGSELRRRGVAAERAAAATAAASARRRARVRWDDADRLVLLPDALEQASDPAVAAWRAGRFTDAEHIWDLCSGVGGDALALARHAPVTALDRDLARLVLLRHNAAVRKAPIVVVAADATTPPTRVDGAVHADPSRRRAAGRVRRLGEYQPSVPVLRDRWRHAEGMAIVLSPAVDLGDPGLPAGGELEFLQVGSTLLEAVWWAGTLAGESSSRRRLMTASLVDHGVRRHGPARHELEVGALGGWLLEMAPAAVRARCHDELGADVGARRLARSRALLTTVADPGPSPWWQRWRVEADLAPRPKQVRRWLRTADDAPLEIAVHGLKTHPDAWWRELGRPARGPQGRRLHLVRTDDGARCIVTRAVDEGARPPRRGPFG